MKFLIRCSIAAAILQITTACWADTPDNQGQDEKPSPPNARANAGSVDRHTLVPTAEPEAEPGSPAARGDMGRYRYFDSRWWYWQANKSWVYWSCDRWVPFDRGPHGVARAIHSNRGRRAVLQAGTYVPGSLR